MTKDSASELKFEDQQELRIERIAIMTAEGIPESVAADYCNSKPELYGPRPE